MPARGDDPIGRFLAPWIADGVFPGAVYLVAEAGRILAHGAIGHAVVDPARIPARPDTLYDLASLTKPLAGALLTVRLEGEGRLRLEDRLADHQPLWRPDDERDGLTLFDLLTHRSGLPAWTPLYLHAADRAARIEWLSRVPLVGRPGEQVVYSCLGYILLGFALERAGAAPLQHLFEQHIARPLGLDDLLFNPPPSLRPRTAATEHGNVRERQLAGPAGTVYNEWRSGIIWAEVHDGNAHTLGGAAGNAGLFGSAGAVYTLAREFLGEGRGLLTEDQRLLFRRNLSGGLQEDRSVGFQLASTAGCSAGPALSPGSFGHTGFTGTSLWIDPASRRIYVLLTNRVHPGFRDVDMNGVRRGFHAVAAAL
jgi:CubicO group peptidase (beta-lactamase class C family)